MSSESAGIFDKELRALYRRMASGEYDLTYNEAIGALEIFKADVMAEFHAARIKEQQRKRENGDLG